MLRLLVASFLTAAGVTGCTTHQCDASSADAGSIGQVTEYDGTWTWQTSSIASGYMPFNHNETITFTLPEGFPSTLTPGFLIVPYVSTGTDQWTDGGGQFVLGGGELAEYQIVGPRSFTVFNYTCTDYYLRIVATVTVPPAPVDAGGDAPHD